MFTVHKKSKENTAGVTAVSANLGKYMTIGVVDTGGTPYVGLRKFSTFFEIALRKLSGPRELIHEKTCSKESRDTVP